MELEKEHDCIFQIKSHIHLGRKDLLFHKICRKRCNVTLCICQEIQYFKIMELEKEHDCIFQIKSYIHLGRKDHFFIKIAEQGQLFVHVSFP